jgi:enediyne biosynthesis protein E3
LKGYGCRAFDQGLGRSLWFVDGADIDRVAATIARFASYRRADLWSGVGLAASYAGGVEASSMSALRQSAGGYWPDLALGAAFAAKARQRAGIIVKHTEVACQILCGMSSDIAARITDEALNSVAGDGEEPAYEIWRTLVRDQLLAITNGS